MELPEFWKAFATTFTVVFFAELGDKTQLATLLLASENASLKWAVFLGSAAALVLAAAIGVVAGSAISYYVSEKTLRFVASLGFIVMGVWLLRGALLPAP